VQPQTIAVQGNDAYDAGVAPTDRNFAVARLINVAAQAGDQMLVSDRERDVLQEKMKGVIRYAG